MGLSEEPITAAAPDGGDRRVAALTFDDGPNGAATETLLDYLEARGLRAVFAVVGENILAPGGVDTLRRTVKSGHVLCNHSMSFADMGQWDAAAVRADLERANEVIRAALDDADVPIPFFRAPNGSWGVTAAVAVEMGMQPLGVVNHIGDWEEQDPDVLAERLQLAITPGELVLAHDGGGSRAGTVEAVKRVVEEKLADGWRFTLPPGAQ